MLIESGDPTTWRKLEELVAQILDVCCMEVESPKIVETVRGSVEIDVFASDDATTPDSVYLCECKHWDSNVPKAIVHAFRTVVSDSGANTGLVVSKLGFQPGAIEAARHTNIRLLSWSEFQDLFAERWFLNHIAPLARRELDPFIEYTEPINSRIFQKADQLLAEDRERFKELRNDHFVLPFLLTSMIYPALMYTNSPRLHPLPLREHLESYGSPELEGLSSDILDEVALRPFFAAVFSYTQEVVAEFDKVFGERA